MRELRVSKVRHDACSFFAFFEIQIFGGNLEKLHNSSKNHVRGPQIKAKLIEKIIFIVGGLQIRETLMEKIIFTVRGLQIKEKLIEELFLQLGGSRLKKNL